MSAQKNGRHNLVMRFDFLTGRYHATPWGRHVNEGVAEWPPSPWRILRALVSAWKRAMPAVRDGEMESLLTKLAIPPSFYLPPASQGVTKHYMPTSGKATMVFDTFVVIRRDTPVYALWEEQLNDEETSLLARLLTNVNYLGRAESWTDVRLVSGAPAINCQPWMGSDLPEGLEWTRVLVPSPEEGLLDALLCDTGEMRKGKRLAPPRSQWLDYLRSQSAFSIQPKVAAKRKTSTLTVAKFSIHAKPLPSITDTVTIAELARKSVMARYGRRHEGRASPVLSGKDEDGRPLSGHLHAHYVPIDENNDGRIDHLVIFAPSGLPEDELEAIVSLTWLNPGQGKTELNLVFAGVGEYRRVLAPSKTWRSATPFVLGRYPKYYRSGKPKLRDNGLQVDGPVDQVYREWELRRRHDPDLPALESVEFLPECRLKGRRLNWLDFRFWRRRSRGPGAVSGFRLKFAAPTSGPVCLGYGSHFGLGLFVPE